MKYNGLFLVKPGEKKLTEQRARHAPAWSEEYFEGYNQGFRDGYRRSTAALDEIAKESKTPQGVLSVIGIFQQLAGYVFVIDSRVTVIATSTGRC